MFARHDYRCATRVCLTFALTLAVASTQAGDRVMPVPPTQEMVILDPNADAMGKPAVQLVANPITGVQEVNIPPVIIIHKLYYTGDRSFQGPILPGGPSIIVMQHPSTGARCYVSAQMLPGAPVVRYTAGAIEYDYGAQGITVSFGPCGAPVVSYRNHTPITREAGEIATGAFISAGVLVEKTHLPTISQSAWKGTKNLAEHVCDGACAVGKQLAAPAIGLTQSTPIGGLFEGSADEAQRHRDEEVRMATLRAEHSDADIPTLR